VVQTIGGDCRPTNRPCPGRALRPNSRCALPGAPKSSAWLTPNRTTYAYSTPSTGCVLVDRAHCCVLLSPTTTSAPARSVVGIVAHARLDDDTSTDTSPYGAMPVADRRPPYPCMFSPRRGTRPPQTREAGKASPHAPVRRPNGREVHPSWASIAQHGRSYARRGWSVARAYLWNTR